MSTPHPWRALRHLEDVVLAWSDRAPSYLRGGTSGSTIWLRPDLSQVERRCVLAHELEHVRRGHEGCQPGAVERTVQAAAARYLLPSPLVVADALVWSAGHVEEAADVLWVTPRVLQHRLDPRHLHPAERVIINARLLEVDRGA